MPLVTHNCCRLRRERRGPSNSRTCSETFGQLIAEGISREELFKAITEQVGVCVTARGQWAAAGTDLLAYFLLPEFKRHTRTHC